MVSERLLYVAKHVMRFGSEWVNNSAVANAVDSVLGRGLMRWMLTTRR